MAANKPSGLGKGLGALLAKESIPGNEGRTIVELGINEISPNSAQPRQHFDDEKLRELAESIKLNGVIQPIIVTRSGKSYRIVAGERRWRASRLAGLKKIPAIVRELSEQGVLQQALIENIQRQDLNALEEAQALERLLKEFGMTQEEMARVVGRSRPAVANTLRLLNLAPAVKALLREEKISAGHARALLALPDAAAQADCAARIVEADLSVRATEELIKRLLNPKIKREKAKPDPAYQLSLRKLEQAMAERLGTKVALQDRRQRGKIQIDYYSLEDLERIVECLLPDFRL